MFNNNSSNYIYSFYDSTLHFIDNGQNESNSKELNNILDISISKPMQIQQESKIDEFKTKETLNNEKKSTNKIESENSKDIECNSFLNNVSHNLTNKAQKIKELKKDVTTLKKKKSIPTSRHDKFSDDILRKKVKHLVIKNLFNFINDKISEKYQSKISNGVFIKKLLTINHKQKSNFLIKFNQEFLNKSIGDIFSENISTKFTNYPLSHNRDLIQSLLNDEDTNRRIYFNKLFNLTFLDCLKHFRGSEEIEELIGLKTFDSIKKDFEDDMDYLNTLHYHIMNFENIINKKRIKKRHKKDINEKDN